MLTIGMPTHFTIESERPESSSGDSSGDQTRARDLAYSVMIFMVMTDNNQIHLKHFGRRITDPRTVWVKEHSVSFVLKQEATMSQIVQTHRIVIAFARRFPTHKHNAFA